MIRGALRLGLALLLGLAAAPVAADPALPQKVEAAVAAAKNSVVSDAPTKFDDLAKAETLAMGVPDSQQRLTAFATVRWLQGEAHLRSGNPSQAAALFAEGLKLVQPIAAPLKVKGDLLMSQGVLQMQGNHAVQALASFQEAFRVFGTVKQPRSQAIALQNIAALYQTANDVIRAEVYYRQAAETYDGDPMLLLSLHNNSGNVLSIRQRHAAAAAQFKTALAIARRLKEPALEARVLVNLARSQIELKQLDAADQNLSQAFGLTHSDATMLRRQLLGTAARLASARGADSQALSLMRESFAGVDLDTTSAEFRNLHYYARDIFTRSGDTRMALEHVEALRRLDDEAAKVATTTSAALMAARFNYAEQQARIQQLKAEEAERTARYQRSLFTSIGAATLVVMAMLAWGLITIRRSRNRVRAANVVLNDTNVALEKALRAKTEFLATTSHEIRTPLNGILGMTQVMLSDSALAPELRDRIGIVHGAGMTMRSLVDDILDLAKMETGNLTVDLSPMDLCATLREVTRLWEEQARANGLLFRVELTHAPQWIVSDAGRLRQIVFNLLSNAVKFTEKGGIVVRAVAEGDDDARRLRLCVSDTGIGIPAEKLEEVFESFRQADAGTTRRFGGTGLGLTICRNLAQALGGEVLVESVPGEGSRFIVDLPLTLAEAPEQAPVASPAGGTMLIVDRNPIARSMLRTLFEPRVAVLRFAGDLHEALEACADMRVERLLIDESSLGIADGNAPESLRQLVEAAPGATSILLSAKGDVARLSLFRGTGIGKIIEKPVSASALVEALTPSDEEKTVGAKPVTLVSRAA